MILRSQEFAENWEEKQNEAGKKNQGEKRKIMICISGENCSNDSPLDILLHGGEKVVFRKSMYCI